jgi:hypothetical protein
MRQFRSNRDNTTRMDWEAVIVLGISRGLTNHYPEKLWARNLLHVVTRAKRWCQRSQESRQTAVFGNPMLQLPVSSTLAPLGASCHGSKK